MIDLSVSARELDILVHEIGATEDQVRKALRSTLSKMAAWVRTRAVKGLSAELAMAQRILRRRLKAAKFRINSEGGVAKVWFGLNPVDLIWLGAKQNSTGVTAKGGRVVPGGFIATMKNGHKGVFKRRAKARLRIDEQAAEIQTPAEKYIADIVILAAAFEAQFFKVLEHELKWRTR